MMRFQLDRRTFLKLLQWPFWASLANLSPWVGRQAAASEAPPSGRIVRVHHPQASDPAGGLDNVDVAPAVVRRMVDEALLSFTGEKDREAAWRRIIPDPSQKVAIKVNCQIRGIYTKARVVQPLIEGLLSIGVAEENIVIYDLTDNAFDLAGFKPNNGPGVRVGRASDLGGYARYLNHRLANLLTGGHGSSLLNWLAQAAEETRSGMLRWCLGLFLAGQERPWDCRYLINVPVLKALDGYSGVTLSMKNHYGSIGNPGEHHEDIMDYIPFLNGLPPIRRKTRLIVMDAIFCEYKWVNGRDQTYVTRTNRLLVGNDPVAMDYTGWRMIEDQRRDHGLPPVSPAPAFIARAAAAGLGTDDPARIELVELQLKGEAWS